MGEGKKLLNEIQPTRKAECACGSVLWDGDDTRYPIWIGGDPNCLHQVLTILADVELDEIDAQLDEIVNRINASTRKINEINGND